MNSDIEQFTKSYKIYDKYIDKPIVETAYIQNWMSAISKNID